MSGLRQASAAKVWRGRQHREELPEHPGVLALRRACTKYEKKLRSGVVTARADSDLKGQLGRFRQSQELEQMLLSQVRQLLCDAGEDRWRFVSYFNFARYIAGQLARGRAGYSLQEVVKVAVVRWSMMGLDRRVLARICWQVFSLPVDEGAGTSQPPAV